MVASERQKNGLSEGSELVKVDRKQLLCDERALCPSSPSLRSDNEGLDSHLYLHTNLKVQGSYSTYFPVTSINSRQ